MYLFPLFLETERGNPSSHSLIGAGHQVSAQALDQNLIERISSSVMSIRDSNGEVIATAVVWDYTTSHVLLLTNYHTWDDREFKYCFPPPNQAIRKRKNANRKRKNSEDSEKSEEPVELTLSNGDFEHKFVVTSEVFQFCEKEEDFAVLKLPKGGFTMPRIPVGLGVSLTLKVHAFGYIGYTKTLNISSGEVSGFIPEGFSMNLLSAGGFSGAAIIADGYGRAIGYMGGNLDASTKINSQHQSYGYRFDRVITVTNRQLTPTKSPLGEGNICGGKATK